ncbi:MAG: hypothetical protein AAGJ87_00850, partial [Pseudomonadota bacterium]
FGATTGNANVFIWDDTQIEDLSLGFLDPGESLTLEYLVQISVAGTPQIPCTDITFECQVSKAGFGDPEEMGGILYLFNRQGAVVSADFGDVDEIPLPPAAFLFLVGAASLGRRTFARHR